ncbi:MAG: hypothetical protein ACOYMG_24110 [Candidatus Methylumidiphilus sp.]
MPWGYKLLARKKTATMGGLAVGAGRRRFSPVAWALVGIGKARARPSSLARGALGIGLALVALPTWPKALPKPAGKLLHRPFLNRRFNLPNNHRPGGFVSV